MSCLSYTCYMYYMYYLYCVTYCSNDLFLLLLLAPLLASTTKIR